ncbi:MAG: bi-domain-containing oxidoreductase, partial [Candidatus Margulisbacteria bacterium]|nr:bi-domain-containing oxidoreductase [Candidatus Margulisiibacteriota bacterium]
MRQLFVDKQVRCVIDDVPRPTPQAGHVLIKVLYSVISPGTETASLGNSSTVSGNNLSKVMGIIQSGGLERAIEIVKDKLNRLSPKGYSGAGVVVAKGEDVLEFELGDKVAYAGQPHAEYVLAPKNLVAKMPENVAMGEAAFTTLGAIAMQSVRLANIQLGDNVVVVGLGLIGQLAVALAAAAGANVIGIDLVAERVALAQKMGLTNGILSTETDNVIREVMELTKGRGADVVLLCAATASSVPANQAFAYARRKAKVVMVGAMGLNFNRSDLYAKEIDFKVSCSYGPGRYDRDYEVKGQDYPFEYVRWTENRNMNSFLQLLSAGKLNLRPLISKQLIFGQEATEAYRLLMEQKNNLVGILLKYPETAESDDQSGAKIVLRPVLPKQGMINVGVIGVGGFSRNTLIPAIKKIKNVNLSAVADINGVEAKHVAKLKGFGYATTDYKQVLADKNIDVVMIATRHDTHYQIAREALLAGKHVHVEKPMTMDLAQAKELEKLVVSSNKLLQVGYNRRHAPCIKKIKSLLANRNTPLMTLCRVNSGSLPLSHWVNDPHEGGGRLIGEICHFIDLLYWLVEAEIADFGFQKIDSPVSAITARDNISINFK